MLTRVLKMYSGNNECAVARRSAHMMTKELPCETLRLLQECSVRTIKNSAATYWSRVALVQKHVLSTLRSIGNALTEERLLTLFEDNGFEINRFIFARI